MQRFAPAKLNLTLHITGKREDGYHLLESLVVFLDIGDKINVQLSNDLSLTINGLFSNSLVISDDNIMLKAARALQRAANISHGAALHLEKNIPIGAGLGGGSADAAATLRLLNQLWRCDYSLPQLCEIGQTLGADVPACLHGVPLMMTGIGEKIAPIDALPSMPIVLVNPAISLLTKDVYAAYAQHLNPSVSWSVGESLQSARNDLEPAAIELCPAIAKVLKIIAQQQGCVLSRLCGSGATCFGVFEDARAAERAAQAIQAKHSGWWVKATQTKGAQ